MPETGQSRPGALWWTGLHWSRGQGLGLPQGRVVMLRPLKVRGNLWRPGRAANLEQGCLSGHASPLTELPQSEAGMAPEGRPDPALVMGWPTPAALEKKADESWSSWAEG